RLPARSRGLGRRRTAARRAHGRPRGRGGRAARAAPDLRDRAPCAAPGRSAAPPRRRPAMGRRALAGTLPLPRAGRQASEQPLALIAVARPSANATSLAESLSHLLPAEHVRTLELCPLASEGALALARSGGAEIDADRLVTLPRHARRGRRRAPARDRARLLPRVRLGRLRDRPRSGRRRPARPRRLRNQRRSATAATPPPRERVAPPRRPRAVPATRTTMELRLLGPLDVAAADGGAVAIAAAKLRALLAFLLPHANEPVSRGVVVGAGPEALLRWPARGCATAAASSRSARREAGRGRHATHRTRRDGGRVRGRPMYPGYAPADSARGPGDDRDATLVRHRSGTIRWSIAPKIDRPSPSSISIRTRSPKRMNPVRGAPCSTSSSARRSEMQAEPVLRSSLETVPEPTIVPAPSRRVCATCSISRVKS